MLENYNRLNYTLELLNIMVGEFQDHGDVEK